MSGLPKGSNWGGARPGAGRRRGPPPDPEAKFAVAIVKASRGLSDAAAALAAASAANPDLTIEFGAALRDAAAALTKAAASLDRAARAVPISQPALPGFERD
jgi:hypothetical protein